MSAAYQIYLESARTAAPWWRFALALLALFSLWVVASVLVVILISVIAALILPQVNLQALEARTMALMLGGVTGWAGASATLLLLLSIAAFWPACWLAQLIMGARLGSVLSLVNRLRWRLMGKGLVACLLVYGAQLLISVALNPGSYGFTDHLGSFLIYLPLLLACVALQASGEELVFRGWLVQQLGRVWAHPVFTFGVTALAFTALHGANAEVVALGPLAFLMFVAISLPLSYTVWRTGGLEIAFTMHTINNLFASFIVYPNSDKVTTLSGFHLLEFSGDPYPDPTSVLFTLATLLALGAGLFVLLFWRRSPLAITPADLLGRG